MKKIMKKIIFVIGIGTLVLSAGGVVGAFVGALVSWTKPTSPAGTPTLVTSNSHFSVYKFYDNMEYHYVAVGADQNISVSIK